MDPLVQIKRVSARNAEKLRRAAALEAKQKQLAAAQDAKRQEQVLAAAAQTALDADAAAAQLAEDPFNFQADLQEAARAHLKEAASNRAEPGSGTTLDERYDASSKARKRKSAGVQNQHGASSSAGSRRKKTTAGAGGEGCRVFAPTDVGYVQDASGATCWLLPDHDEQGNFGFKLLPMGLLRKHEAEDGAPKEHSEEFEELVAELPLHAKITIGTGPGEYDFVPETTLIENVSTTALIFTRCRLGIQCFSNHTGNMHQFIAGENPNTRASGLSMLSLLRLSAAQAHVLFGKDSTAENNACKNSESRAGANGRVLANSPVHLKAMSGALSFITEKAAGDEYIEQQRVHGADSENAVKATVKNLIGRIQEALGEATIFEYAQQSDPDASGKVLLDDEGAPLDGDLWYVTVRSTPALV